MKNNFISKRIFGAMTATLLLISNSFACSAKEEYPDNFQDYKSNSCSEKYINQEKIILEANSEGSLVSQIISATKNKEKNVEIRLTKDIQLNNSLILNSDINLNLNGHTLKLQNPNAQIEIGKKTLIGKLPYQIYHEGHFERRLKSSYEYKFKYKKSGHKNVQVWEDVWIPGYYTTAYKNEFAWDNSIRVTISNGNIKGANARKANDKTYAYFLTEAHGENGISPADLFKLTSGNLSLNNVLVKSGDGADGGDATYSSLWHVPLIGGGDGGNGGNGGNGSNIFFSEKGNVIVDSNCTLIPGSAGIGGRGSKENPNYWVYGGSAGKNGYIGKDGNIINDESKLFYS